MVLDCFNLKRTSIKDNVVAYEEECNVVVCVCMSMASSTSILDHNDQ